MQTATPFFANPAGMIPLEDLGALQTRYQPMKLAERAKTVLVDAQPALLAAERILTKLKDHSHTIRVISRLRADGSLINKMRACEARNVLLDSKVDFMDTTMNKIAAWRKTMQRVAKGEGIHTNANGKEYIPSSDPMAIAVFGISNLGHYLSIAQLIIADVAHADKVDKLPTSEWTACVAEMRRCATVIGDYEFATGFTAVVN
ncbi:MAG: hypothetical protein EBR02_05655 [Alphaproteobacteria bacterium]|nr:hypothetical protein [Alphaproteobacteria bacterium]